jgi:hypothetical protein
MGSKAPPRAQIETGAANQWLSFGIPLRKTAGKLNSVAAAHISLQFNY